MLKLVNWSVGHFVESSKRRRARDFARNASDDLLRDIGMSRSDFYRAMAGSHR